MNIINILDNVISNSQNELVEDKTLYISDDDIEDKDDNKDIISFQCYNKKGVCENHIIPLDEWNNYIQNFGTIYHILCPTCNRILNKDEYIKNGLYIWKIDDKIIEKCNYVNGKLDGLYERFYINGIPYERTNYKDGIYQGTCEFWYDITGKKMKTMNFENGKLHGLYKYWDQNGKLIEDIYYNNGIRSDILVKIPSKIIVKEDCIKDFNYDFEKKNDNKEYDENIFDLSKKKKKKDKKDRKDRKEETSDSD